MASMLAVTPQGSRPTTAAPRHGAFWGRVPRRTVDSPPRARQGGRLLQNPGASVLVAFVAVAAPQATQAGTPKADVQARVAAVADGDTLTVLDAENVQHKVRLACVDALEKRQDFGAQCKKSLSELAFGKAVRVIVRDRDRYDRLVGTTMVGELDVNLERVSSRENGEGRAPSRLHLARRPLAPPPVGAEAAKG